MQQDEIIRRFVATYNECQAFEYQIMRWPDRENSRSRDCDAYAEAVGGRPLAIEHTYIQSFRNQKLDSARFMQICGELERELKHAFDFEIHLIIPTFAIQPGTDWNEIRDTLHEWLLSEVPQLSFGGSHHEIEGVPFRVSITKEESPERLFSVSRWTPPAHEDKADLVQIMESALGDKNNQLSKYRAAGAETVLILQSDDIALVNWSILYKAFLLAHQHVQTPNIDQVWLARTYDSNCSIRCFVGPESVMHKVNPRNALIGPRYAEYWARALQQGT